MKRYNLQSILCGISLSALTMSCENQEISFPDYDKSTVYFAYQYPVRTIVLGEDIYDTSLDNDYKCQIYATMGGVYENKKKIDIDIAVDNSLCNKLYLDAAFTVPVQPMPANYYTLSGNQISLDHKLQGAVGVQLTDAFFADANALQNTYVIPLRMLNVTNADAILSGLPKVQEPDKVNASHWDIQPKDYVLYFIKYINPWHANYLRRGKDQITVNGATSTITRHQPTVEADELRSLSTLSLHELKYTQDYKGYSGLNLNLALKLNFNEDESCTVEPHVTAYDVNDSVSVYNISATGSGAFVKKGEKKSWGNKDRDVLYLQYNVSYEVETTYPNAGLPNRTDQVSYVTSDTLVVRDRGVKVEVLTPFYKN
ncbi:DUF5627 domain-containing protein [Pseudochryseolinea flava]|uniref:Adhesin n=1 Tax=Pseudochryseolinea flava TaxID=2059302 RepID=A0A364Y7W7_9BACT|nr:DUF5627 domain-containing protein [Pseudochryseolinea flava]RAW02575.1 adhesin [Pseudochryseolinea flava]